MDQAHNLDEQILRAQREFNSWGDEKKSMMRLQGTDYFNEKSSASDRSEPFKSKEAPQDV